MTIPSWFFFIPTRILKWPLNPIVGSDTHNYIPLLNACASTVWDNIFLLVFVMGLWHLIWPIKVNGSCSGM